MHSREKLRVCHNIVKLHGFFETCEAQTGNTSTKNSGEILQIRALVFRYVPIVRTLIQILFGDLSLTRRNFDFLYSGSGNWETRCIKFWSC